MKFWPIKSLVRILPFPGSQIRLNWCGNLDMILFTIFGPWKLKKSFTIVESKSVTCRNLKSREHKSHWYVYFREKFRQLWATNGFFSVQEMRKRFNKALELMSVRRIIENFICAGCCSLWRMPTTFFVFIFELQDWPGLILIISGLRVRVNDIIILQSPAHNAHW